MADLILVVEDDGNIGALVRTYLERDGYETVWVRSGLEALAELERLPIRLVLLDIGLPDMDGLEVCRRIGGRVPVVILSARDEVGDRVAGLELGADDYLPKPFSPRELTARIKAVLRRAGSQTGTPYSGTPYSGAPYRGTPPAGTPHGSEQTVTLGPVALLPAAREVYADGIEVELTQREFDLLEYLVRNHGRVVGRDELLEVVWGFAAPGLTRTVEVHVAQLRKKLGHPELIRTVRGIGYRAVS